MSIHHVAGENEDGSVSKDHYYLYHPSVGTIELGMSTFLRWRTKPRDFIGQPGYFTSAGLYATWLLEDHRLTLRIEKAFKRNTGTSRGARR